MLRCVLTRFVAVLLLELLGAPLEAGAQPQRLADMDHTMWTARDGAPQAIKALAQAADGTLWIGSETGLVNFDGLRFRKFESAPGDPPFPTAAVDSLLFTKDGTLWVGFDKGGAARIKTGRVSVYEKVGQQRLPTIHQPRESRDGSIWAIVNAEELIRFDRDETWHLEKPPQTTRVSGIFIDSTDTLWLAQGGLLFRRPLHQSSYQRTGVAVAYAIEFVETPDGQIWITDMDVPAGRGTTRLIDWQGNLVSVLPFTKYASGLLYASDGSLILPLQIMHGGGVRRFSAEALSGREGHDRPDVLTEAQGLSSNAANEALIDSHGNIWIGGNRGLDRLRPQQLTPFDRDHGDARWVVCASPAGELWIGNALNQLYRVTRGTRTLVPGVKGLYALACRDGDRAWFASSGGASAVAGITVTEIPPVPGMRTYNLSRIAVAPDHSMYATVPGSAADGGGVWHYQDRRWSRLPGDAFVGSLAAPILYLDSHSRLWTGYGEQIRMYSSGRTQRFTSGEPGLGYVFALLETSRGFFAAGNGVAVLRDSRFVPLAFADPAFVQGVRGLVQSHNGDLWLNAASGIAHIPARELDAGLANGSYPIKADLITEGEFAGAARVEGRSDTAARDADGRLWFATRNGVVSLDPERWKGAIDPPIVTIRSMAADGQRVDERGAVAPGLRTLTIQYQGINLTAPDGVIYRYRLAGFDEGWQEAGRRTEAIYTRVLPGTYTFMVMASNGDGRWTEPVSSKPFTILPEFYQTGWFATAAIATGLLLLFAIYRIRVRQLASVMSARFDERLGERTRIARELHDTLLQTFQGVLIHFQAARNLLPQRPDEAGQRLDRVLNQAAQAITEGRDAVQDLRESPASSGDLSRELSVLADQLSGESEPARAATIRVNVEGSPRRLHPIVKDDVYRIASEAIRNAVRHAQAQLIQVDIHYDDRHLQLRIRDDGTGIDAAIVDGRGVSGHWGLPGMRERAALISGTLSVRSRIGSGTAIELSLPASKAYVTAAARRFPWPGLAR